MHNHSRHHEGERGTGGLAQRYTRNEVGRILGLEPNRLRYWERLRLVRPEARWGERFYSFGDLVALRSIQRITQNRVPARRVRRAVALMEKQFGAAPVPIQELRLVEFGREVHVVPPGSERPFNPFLRQWAFPFDLTPQPAKLRAMVGPTPEDFFQSALDCESRAETLPASHRKLSARGGTRAELDRSAHQSRRRLLPAGPALRRAQCFLTAVQIDPLNGISRYNLGCTLEELGELDEAIDHLRRAARAMPAHADVHFNLALAYEKTGERSAAHEQWALYLRYAPSGPWADQARERLQQSSGKRKRSAPIPFRRPS